MEASRVSVVIPVFNGGTDLQKCLDAISRLSYPVHECILVDDASTDGMTARVGRQHGAQVIPLTEQGGPAHARNLGVKAATGDLIFFVDADVVVKPDTLGTAVNVLETHPETAAVFGSYDDKPGHPAFLSQYRNLLHHWVHQAHGEQASTFWTGCGLIRRDVFLQMGGLKTSYQKPSIEDIELGSRLHRTGHGIRLEKSMLCKHLKQWRFWNMVKTDIFQRGVPWVVLLLENPGMPKDLNLNAKSRIATIVAGLLALCTVVLPFTGHAMALAPGLAFLVVASGFSLLAGKQKDDAWVTVALAIAAPLAAYLIFPDTLAIVPLGLILLLAWTHLAFYRFLVKNRNTAFAIAVIPVQVIFYLGCALAIVLGLFQHLFSTHRNVSTS